MVFRDESEEEEEGAIIESQSSQAIFNRHAITFSYHTIKLDKAMHLQFPRFKVILLVFETAQAVKRFVEKAEPPMLNQSRKINPGELVAVCLKGEEERYARHLPIFGLVNEVPVPLENNDQEQVDKPAATETTNFRQHSIWTAGMESSRKTDKLEDFDQLGPDLAQWAEGVLRKNLFKLHHSPNILASDARRMVFGERYLYAAVVEGQLPLLGPTQWSRAPDDDCLLPCLSIEWPKGATTSAADSLVRLESSTGYHIEETNSPLILIINRHFPHRRAAGMKYLQFVPPTLVLSQASVKLHELNQKHRQRLGLLRQMQNINPQDIKAGSATHQSIAQAALLQMADFIVDLQCFPKDDDESIRQIAGLAKDIFPNSTSTFQDNACPTAKEQRKFLFTSSECLEDAFDIDDDQFKPFFNAMKGTTSSISSISNDVKQCLFTIFRFAFANSASLCGREVELDEARMEVDSAEQCLETAAKEGQSSKAIQMECQEQRQAARGQGSNDLNSHEHTYLRDLRELPLTAESTVIIRKRSLDEPLKQSKAKYIKIEPGRGQIKELLQHIIEADSESGDLQEYKRLLMESAQLVATELEKGKGVTQEAIALCQGTVQDSDMTDEDRIRGLMDAVKRIFILANGQEETGEWDWVLLTLAHRATETLNKICRDLEKSYRNMRASTTSTLQDEIRRIGQFSGAFITFMAKFLVKFDETLKWPKHRISAYHLYVEELDEVDIKALLSIEQIKAPTVYIGFIPIESMKGPEIDRQATRFRESVFEVLFQAFFSALCHFLSNRNLDGSRFNGNSARRDLRRKLLRFRLQFIGQLVDKTHSGTALFASNLCSGFVFESTRYFPLLKSNENFFNTVGAPNKLPPLMETEGLIPTELSRSRGWEALYSALRSVKDDIHRLADKRDPSRTIITHAIF